MTELLSGEKEMKRKKRSSARSARKLQGPGRRLPGSGKRLLVPGKSLLGSGGRKAVTYILAALVAAGTTHAMILPAMGVDVHELAGEADVGRSPVVNDDEASSPDVGGTSDPDVAGKSAADVGEVPGVDAEMDAGAVTEVDAGIDARTVTNVDMTAESGTAADAEATADAGTAADTESAADAESTAGAEAIADAELSEDAGTVTALDAASDSETAWEIDTASGPDAIEELYAETENFAVTVFCNSNGENTDAAAIPEVSDIPDTADVPVVTEPLLILEEAEETSETFSEAKAALTELRREKDESYKPDTENYAVLDMQLEDIDPDNPIKINLRVRQVPEEISNEAFIRTAEIHKFQLVDENKEESADLPGEAESTHPIQNLQTTGVQTAGFRMEQGVLSADLTADLPENEPLSIVISWAAEEQEASPASGEFVNTAGTEIKDTTEIGIAEDASVIDMDSSDTLPDIANTEMAIEDCTTDAIEDRTTDASKDSTTDTAAGNVTDQVTDNKSPEPDYNGYELPATGGPGRRPYRVAGGLLSVAALIALQITGSEKSRERRQKKGSGFE